MSLIGYQGIKGSYSESLIIDYNLGTGFSCKNFEDIFWNLKNDKITYGLIPIENNLGGSLHVNYDLLLEHKFKIIKEYNYPINHCLICNSETNLEDIKLIRSHPQALAQCSNILKEIKIDYKEYYDTAGSVKLLKNGIAGIASERAAKIYNIKVIKKDIQNNKFNMTRFLLISKNDNNMNNGNKISIAVCLHNQNGILAKTLSIFSDNGIDLSKIESRPNLIYRNKQNIPYQYLFYIDLIGNLNNNKIKLSLEKIKKLCVYFKLLGNYECIYPKNFFNKKLNIGIIGFGRFGQFLGKHLSEYHNIFATSRTNYSNKFLNSEINFFNNIDEFYKLDLDCIIIATSIMSFEKVLNKLNKNFLKNKLIIDVLSVKGFAKKKLLDLNIDCDILCTHPMFGPDSGKDNWLNLNFVYEKVKRTNITRCNNFLSFFEKKGCRMKEISCEEHDKYSANSQFITHLTGRILANLNIKSTPINTSGFNNLLDLVKNTTNDSFDLFEGLYINNLNSIETLKNFKSSLEDIIIKLTKQKLNIVKESGTSEFVRIINKYKDDTKFLNFTIGEPDYNPPNIIKDNIKEIVDKEKIRYTSTEGLYELRNNISKYLNKSNLNYNSDEILCSNGAKQSIFQVLLYLIKYGDEVIIIKPSWPSYESIVDLLNGKKIFLDTKIENNYDINLKKLEEKITKKTKLLILCNPSNPTGTIYSKKTLIGISKLVLKYNFFILSDEVYNFISHTDYISFASLDKMKEYTFTINSFSKNFGMTGYRLGYVASTKSHIKNLISIQSQTTSSANYISQRCVHNLFNYIGEMKDNLIKLKDNCNIIYEGLINIGLSCTKPEGAIYIFPDISKYYNKKYNNKKIKNAKDFCKYLLEDYKIGFLPGEIFNSPNNVRICYGINTDKINKMLILLKEYINKIS